MDQCIRKTNSAVSCSVATTGEQNTQESVYLNTIQLRMNERIQHYQLQNRLIFKKYSLHLSYNDTIIHNNIININTKIVTHNKLKTFISNFLDNNNIILILYTNHELYLTNLNIVTFPLYVAKNM